MKLPQKFEVVAVIVEQNESFIAFLTLENMGLEKKYNALRISLKTPISTAILNFAVVAVIVEHK